MAGPLGHIRDMKIKIDQDKLNLSYTEPEPFAAYLGKNIIYYYFPQWPHYLYNYL